MDERRLELIDRYLRGEMSPDEMVEFEQEVIDDDELRRELELTYCIKRCLTRREQKLRQTAEWIHKRRRQHAYTIAFLSIAAMLVVGLFVYRYWETDNTKRQLLALEQQQDSIEKAAKPNSRIIPHGREDYVALVKADIGHKSYKEAVAKVEIMEHSNEIPTLEAMTGDADRNRTHAATSDSGFVSYDNAYELHWLKICSMAKLGETDYAVKSLRTFTTIDGKYKHQADSLLMELEKEEKRP